MKKKIHVGFILAFNIYALAAKTQCGSRHLELSTVQLLPYLFLILGGEGLATRFHMLSGSSRDLTVTSVPSVHKH